MSKYISIISLFSIFLLTTGCATVTSGTTQDLSVSSDSSTGVAVTGADCKLENDKGKWNITTPGVVTVHKSSKDLNIKCNKAGHTNGSARVVSRAGAAIAGNLLVGGLIGAGIDHATGSAYKYADNLVVTMGKTTVIDRRANEAALANDKKEVSKNQ